MAAEHAEATETIGRRHLEMRNKQRGALAAAVAMTERELPTAVDEEISNIFIQISDKLYLAWKERRGLMMNFTKICQGLSNDNGFVTEQDLISSLNAVGIQFTRQEHGLFCNVLYPKNSHGEFNCAKICDLIMSGMSLLNSDNENENVNNEQVERNVLNL